MRKDMKKVLCESPRSHSWDGYGYIRAAEKRGDYDDLPSYQGMRRPYGYDHKEFTDHITPLIRYLWSCVGRPYDEVWSEICATVPSNNTVDSHLKDHVRGEVETNTFIVNDEVFVHGRYGSGSSKPHGLYVDPRDGLIHASVVDRHHTRRNNWRGEKVVHINGSTYTKGDDGVFYPARRWHSPDKYPYPFKPIDKHAEAVKIDGIWYRFVFSIVPNPKTITVYEYGEQRSKVVKFPKQDVLYWNLYQKVGIVRKNSKCRLWNCANTVSRTTNYSCGLHVPSKLPFRERRQ